MSKMSKLLKLAELATIDEKKLPHADQKRLAKIREYIGRLDDGIDVQNRDMKSVLTVQQFSKMNEEWEKEKNSRDYKPEEIRQYEERLNKALFAYNKGDSYSGRGKSELAQDCFHDAERQFESLLEYKDEIVSKNPSLSGWFDRTGGGIDPNTIPRIVTSRSLHKASGGASPIGKLTKRDIKRNALYDALGEYGLAS